MQLWLKVEGKVILYTQEDRNSFFQVISSPLEREELNLNSPSIIIAWAPVDVIVLLGRVVSTFSMMIQKTTMGNFTSRIS